MTTSYSELKRKGEPMIPERDTYTVRQLSPYERAKREQLKQKTRNKKNDERRQALLKLIEVL